MNEPRVSKILILEHSSSEVRFRRLNHNQCDSQPCHTIGKSQINQKQLKLDWTKDTWKFTTLKHIALFITQYLTLCMYLQLYRYKLREDSQKKCLEVHHYLLFNGKTKWLNLCHTRYFKHTLPCQELQPLLLVYASVFSPFSLLTHTTKTEQKRVTDSRCKWASQVRFIAIFNTSLVASAFLCAKFQPRLRTERPKYLFT